MTDHTELVKRLRNFLDESIVPEKCGGCPYDEYYPPCSVCIDRMIKESADAIEELKAKVNALQQYKEKGYTCNDCYLSMQNCHDREICCEDETGLCDLFEEIPTDKVEKHESDDSM